MGIKVSHTHNDGKICYAITGRHQLTEQSLIIINNRSYAVGYMPYTGSWYCYDPNSGAEIARFDRNFFEKAIKQFIYSDLVEDPDCVI